MLYGADYLLERHAATHGHEVQLNEIDCTGRLHKDTAHKFIPINDIISVVRRVADDQVIRDAATRFDSSQKWLDHILELRPSELVIELKQIVFRVP